MLTLTVQCGRNASGGNTMTPNNSWAAMSWPYEWAILWAMHDSSSFSGHVYVELRDISALMTCVSVVLIMRQRGYL